MNDTIRARLNRCLRLLSKYETAIMDVTEEMRDLSRIVDLGDEMEEALELLDSLDFGGIRERIVTAMRMLP